MNWRGGEPDVNAVTFCKRVGKYFVTFIYFIK